MTPPMAMEFKATITDCIRCLIIGKMTNKTRRNVSAAEIMPIMDRVRYKSAGRRCVPPYQAGPPGLKRRNEKNQGG